MRVTQTGAQQLVAARIEGSRLAEIPIAARPMTEDAAYDCQDEVIDRLLAHYGGEIIGYKVACTNLAAQRQLGVSGPFFGRLLSAFLHDSPARLPASDFQERVIEAEFAFCIARDLPARPSTREEIADAIAGVIPGIEIVDSRFQEWTTVGAPCLTADNACNAAWVRGRMIEDWRRIDLATQATSVTVNGSVVRRGNGAAVLGHPLNAMEWLVKRLAERGLNLRAGQFVTTGVTTEVYNASRGDSITADFGLAGTAHLEFC